MAPTTPQYDVIIIGAGFSGIRTLWEVKRLGLSTTCLEAGSDVGGVWYWNRYPGARTDSEGWAYSMNFDPSLKDLWKYGERYPSQVEVQEYLDRISNAFDLRKHIQFNKHVQSCHYNESDNAWVITTSDGTSLTCRYFVAATGPLSMAKKLPFPGLESFKGEWYQTSNWPKAKPNFQGKRVAIVGTGATAVQVIPKVAAVAKELLVFQRTPNYVLPGRNYNIDDSDAVSIREHYDVEWDRASKHVFGLPMVPSGRTLKDMKDDDEIRQVLDNGWEAGGFYMSFATFDDVLTDADCNAVVSEYLRNKIHAIVKDESTADMLSPKYPFMSKRPPCGHSYYETFNKPNVKLIDIHDDQVDMYDKGIRTVKAGGEYEVDVIIFALGFDAGTGALCDIDVRGNGGQSLKESWNEKVQSFAGALAPGFPNMFMICGPQVPFGNMPVISHHSAEWIGKTLKHMKDNSFDKIEVKDGVVQAYLDELNAVFNATLFAESAKEIGAWFVGANIPGKTLEPVFYFGGVDNWVNWLAKESDGAWANMKFSQPV